MAKVIKFSPRRDISEDDLLEHMASLLSASQAVEDRAYAMAGDFDPGVVAEMILISARLEGISRIIAKSSKA